MVIYTENINTIIVDNYNTENVYNALTNTIPYYTKIDQILGILFIPI